MSSRTLSMFIGPGAENIGLFHRLLSHGLGRIADNRRRTFDGDLSLYPDDHDFSADESDLRAALEQLFDRLEGSIPFFHPRYAAQMLKDPCIPALLGYTLTMLSNPNNHAYEGGPPTTEMEMEVVDDLLRLIGFSSGWGHLTSGGSLANLEALWAVRDRLRLPGGGRVPEKGRVLYSRASHLSWNRICRILDIDSCRELPVDRDFRIDLNALERELKSGPVLMVMANFGTTGCGAVDPISEIVRLREKYPFHLHVDAAYGGYFKSLLRDESNAIRPFERIEPDLSRYVYDQALALAEADSVTIDPHKHGLMPYGAGSVLYRHEDLRHVIQNTAPYTYHIKDRPNIGTFSLEGSRPGAAAAGCWMTHKLFPLNSAGLGAVLSGSLRTARTLHGSTEGLPDLVALTRPDLDIFCFYIRKHQDDTLERLNERSLVLYDRFSVQNPSAPFFLSKLVIDPDTARRLVPDLSHGNESLIALRAVFIKHWIGLPRGEPILHDLVSILESL